MDRYTSEVIRICTAKLAHNLGFNTIQVGSLDVLTDVVRLYLEDLCQHLKIVTEFDGRHLPTVKDLQRIFIDKQISIEEIDEYIKQVAQDPLPYKIAEYPVKSHKCRHLFGLISERELALRHDSIPTYFPCQNPELLVEEKSKISTKEGHLEAMEVFGASNPTRISGFKRRSTLVERRRTNSSVPTDELPDFTDFDAFQLGLIRIRAPSPKAVFKPPKITVKEPVHILDHIEISPNESRPKIAISPPEPCSLPEKSRPGPKTTEENNGGDTHDLEPGEIGGPFPDETTSLDSSIDACIDTVIGGHLVTNKDVGGDVDNGTKVADSTDGVLLIIPDPSLISVEKASQPRNKIPKLKKLKIRDKHDKLVEMMKKKFGTKRNFEKERQKHDKVIGEIVKSSYKADLKTKKKKKLEKAPKKHKSFTGQVCSVPNFPAISQQIPESQSFSINKSPEMGKATNKSLEIPKLASKKDPKGASSLKLNELHQNQEKRPRIMCTIVSEKPTKDDLNLQKVKRKKAKKDKERHRRKHREKKKENDEEEGGNQLDLKNATKRKLNSSKLESNVPIKVPKLTIKRPVVSTENPIVSEKDLPRLKLSLKLPAFKITTRDQVSSKILPSTRSSSPLVHPSSPLPKTPSPSRPPSVTDVAYPDSNPPPSILPRVETQCANKSDQIWICPVCSVAYVEESADMIGCDACDLWFHWNCVGLLVAPPDSQPWYCNSCARHKYSKLSQKKSAFQKNRRKTNESSKKKQ